MDHPRILIQLDTDRHASAFDAVVAVDSRVDHLLQYASVEPENVRGLVHGAMFTRGAAQLHRTAVFVGGSNVQAGELIAGEVRQAFFGPVRVSVMLDSNGSNTTAAAAVLSAARHLDLSQAVALVLGGTGPVGQRVARLMLAQGAEVWLASRDSQRSEQACQRILQQVGAAASGRLHPCASKHDDQSSDDQNSDDQNSDDPISKILKRMTLVFGCGAAGTNLLNDAQMRQAAELRVAIDLNAVPPAGIAGIAPTDKAVQRGGRVDYGAIGVGGLKMKIHREAIETLFTGNDLFLDAEEIFEIGKNLELAAKV